jgi:RNA polymerase sigma-70 factor, ECF subfamily
VNNIRTRITRAGARRAPSSRCPSLPRGGWLLHRDGHRFPPCATYTIQMTVRDGTLESPTPVAALAPSERAVDATAHLAAVYRDYPGLRALILRRVRDPETAADILQDAAVTTLEKLRVGEIAHVENVGGYLYRVALNHLRNHRRKDRGPVSSSDELESLAQPDADPEWRSVGHPEWAAAARRMLEEMPTSRDRDLLVRFYLDDEDKQTICVALGLSDEHFNRVIFRARSRFRVLLERRGFVRSDFLALAALGLALAAAGATMLRTADALADPAAGADAAIRAPPTGAAR